jgi:hypothetical protein
VGRAPGCDCCGIVMLSSDREGPTSVLPHVSVAPPSVLPHVTVGGPDCRRQIGGGRDAESLPTSTPRAFCSGTRCVPGQTATGTILANVSPASAVARRPEWARHRPAGRVRRNFVRQVRVVQVLPTSGTPEQRPVLTTKRRSYGLGANICRSRGHETGAEWDRVAAQTGRGTMKPAPSGIASGSGRRTGYLRTEEAPE